MGRGGASWALRQAVPTAHHRLVLAVLADLADDNGVVVASADYLADATMLSNRTVRSVLKDFENSRMIDKTRRRSIKGHEAGPRICLTEWSVADCGEPISRWQGLPSGKAPLATRAVKDVDSRPRSRRCDEETRDVLTPEGLRWALREAADDDWSGPVVDSIAIAIEVTVKTRLAWLVNRRAGRDREESRMDLASHLWEVMRSNTGQLIEAGNPWGLVVVITAKAIAARDEREGLGAVPVDEIHGDVMDLGDCSLTGVEHVGFEDLDDRGPLAQIVFLLCAIGMNETVAWQGVRRVLEIAAKTSPSRRVTQARADKALADAGYSPDAAGALMSLIAGTRRGGDDESMFLRLSQGGSGVTRGEARRISRVAEPFLAVSTG